MPSTCRIASVVFFRHETERRVRHRHCGPLPLIAPISNAKSVKKLALNVRDCTFELEHVLVNVKF